MAGKRKRKAAQRVNGPPESATLVFKEISGGRAAFVYEGFDAARILRSPKGVMEELDGSKRVCKPSYEATISEYQLLRARKAFVEAGLLPHPANGIATCPPSSPASRPEP